MEGYNEPIAVVHSEAVTVGTTIVQVPSHTHAQWVQFMHSHATAKVYIGGDDVSTTNGWAGLEYKDTTERYPVINTDVFYLITDTAGVSVQILWGE